MLPPEEPNQNHRNNEQWNKGHIEIQTLLNPGPQCGNIKIKLNQEMGLNREVQRTAWGQAKPT